jgi:hypothetical protein
MSSTSKWPRRCDGLSADATDIFTIVSRTAHGILHLHRMVVCQTCVIRYGNWMISFESHW